MSLSRNFYQHFGHPQVVALMQQAGFSSARVETKELVFHKMRYMGQVVSGEKD